MAFDKRLGRLVSPRVVVTVSAAEIEHSVRRNSSHCMIAEAVKRCQPGATGISVDLQTVRWTNPAKGLRYIYLTPRAAQVALIDYDQGQHPKPFSFVLSGGQTIPSSGNRPNREKKEKPEPALPGLLPKKKAKPRAKMEESVIDAVAAHPDGAKVEDVQKFVHDRFGIDRKLAHIKAALTTNRIANWIEPKGDRWFLRELEDLPEMPSKQRLAPIKGHNNAHTHNGVLGGKAPPRSHYGKRRGFGLRNFGAY